MSDDFASELQSFDHLDDEFSSADFGDARRVARAAQIIGRLASAPKLPFPRLFATKAELEGFYRFVNNDTVTFLELVRAHADSTHARASAFSEVLAVHDTTSFAFAHPVDGIGRLQGRKKGFFAHTCLGVAGDGTRRPLGVLGMLPYVRTEPARGKNLSGGQSSRLADGESARWFDLVELVEAECDARLRLIHVMDREGDSYRLLDALLSRSSHFVIRASSDRNVDGLDGVRSALRDAMSKAPVRCTREVPLAGRGELRTERGQKRRSARTARVAHLEIAACPVVLHRPKYLSDGHPEIRINAVRVSEVDPPVGEQRVDWILFTTEPIETTAQIERIVDIYRARWTIEEFFKALKTGCEFEKRQFESLEALLNVLALLMPVACKILELRTLARIDGQQPATEVLSDTQLAVLRALRPKFNLAGEPTVREALLAVAALGGHQKSNGEPGWMILGRGMEALLGAEVGWLAAIRTFGGGEKM